ncbi:hypothetical protein Tco_1130251 [Tanacetum coccineum]
MTLRLRYPLLHEELEKTYVSPPLGMLLGHNTYLTQCLGGKTGGLDKISYKDATILYCLANVVQVDYAKIIWEDLIHKLNNKTREKIIPYPRFLSLLLEHMMPEYENKEHTINPTQVFSVHNLTLKPNQPEEPPLTDHIKAICNLDVPVDSKAPKPSSNVERVPEGTNPGAKPGHKKHSTFSKQPSMSSKEATKGRSSKAPTDSKTDHSKKRKESSLAMDSNPSQPLVTSEARANPQINSGHDASTYSTTEADIGISAPKDSVGIYRFEDYKTY